MVFTRPSTGMRFTWQLKTFMKMLTRFIGARTERKLDRLIRQYGAGAVFLFRLSPFLSNDAVSLVAGMLGMSFRRFLLATLAGITPLAVALGLFSESPEQLKTGFIWVGSAGILLYGVYVWLDRSGRSAAKEEDADPE